MNEGNLRGSYAGSGPKAPAAPQQRRRWTLRRLVFRNTLAALIATGVDGLVYAGARRLALCNPGWATAVGAFIGAGVNSTLNRAWTFGSRQPLGPEMLRYAATSPGCGVVSSVGVQLWASHAPNAPKGLIWMAVKCAISWGLGLPCQRFFVFGGRLLRGGEGTRPPLNV